MTCKRAYSRFSFTFSKKNIEGCQEPRVGRVTFQSYIKVTSLPSLLPDTALLRVHDYEVYIIVHIYPRAQHALQKLFHVSVENSWTISRSSARLYRHAWLLPSGLRDLLDKPKLCPFPRRVSTAAPSKPSVSNRFNSSCQACSRAQSLVCH